MINISISGCVLLVGLAFDLNVSSGFTFDWSWCLLHSQVSPRAFVLCSPLRLSIMPLRRGDFSHLCLLSAAKPGCPVLPVVGGSHSDNRFLIPFNGWASSGWGYLSANLMFEVFRFIPSILFKPIFSQPP